ncbi:Structural constituent of ribosome [Heracleum sosnowskyi]|uniref:Structural constituent of ribosome n=1 Tax=Heracleum sosnowskyi TaxID=360622 RepID=A0AAD8MAH9_9APIA|nr:Structural constituent of ribosome [Heracleum sosnowskyi]
MQRWCSKLRPLVAAVNHRSTTTTTILTRPHRLLHSSSTSNHFIHKPLFVSSNFNPLFVAPSRTSLSLFSYASPCNVSLIQVRHWTLKQRKRTLKLRRPATPIVSKVKKVKMKSYSSYKGRFRVMNDGLIRRWKEGKRHNAHLKSKKSKRRLRQPGIVPAAYAKVMKKLNFGA